MRAADAQRNQEQVAAAKAYLESVLGNLSAGVMSFDCGTAPAFGQSAAPSRFWASTSAR